MSFDFFMRNLMESFSYALSFLFLLFYVYRNKQAKLRVLAFYFFVAALLMLRGAYAFPNIMLYSMLSVASAIFLGVYFFDTYLRKWKKRVVILIVIGQCVYFLINNFVFAQPVIFDSAGHVLLSTGIVVMAFLFMHQILTNITEEPLSDNFDFWFVSTQLIYHLGAFGIFLTYGYLTSRILPTGLYSKENRNLISNVWLVHNVLLFLTALLLAAGILWITFRRKSRSSL